MMKYLLPFVALALCVFAPTVSSYGGIGSYGGMASYGGKAAYGGAPVGLLVAQRLEPAYGVSYGNGAYAAPIPNAPYAPAPYAAPIASYGMASGAGYDDNAQIQSLTKLALSLPVPNPDAGQLKGINYGGKQASYIASPRAY